jgi:hypothetical protein
MEDHWRPGIVDPRQPYVYGLPVFATADKVWSTAGSGKTVLWYAMPQLFSILCTHYLADQLNNHPSRSAHA